MYLMHVCEQPTKVFIGYATSNLIESLQKIEDEKARKILVHYGKKAKARGIKYTMMKGTESNPAALLCKAVTNYSIDHLVLGRRGISTVHRFFVGSTSKYCVENADCNVVVIKSPVGPEEEHENKSKVIQLEEHERIRRLEEAADDQTEDKKKELQQVVKAEEAERQRRLREDGLMTKARIDGMIKTYKFMDDIKKDH